MGPKRSRQLSLELPPSNGWGGARTGAGRKPAGSEAGISHRLRELAPRAPAHVTLRARRDAPSLRTPRPFAVVAAALRALGTREDFRVVHYSVQATHVHLVVEADRAAALGVAMRALSIRLTLRMNALLGTTGRFLSDRYHAHVLRTPTEVRRAVAYVVGNHASHARRRGEVVPDGFVDPCSSAAPIGLDGLPPAVRPPRTWLLASAVVREPEAEYGPGAACPLRRAA